MSQSDISERARRRVSRRLIPFLFILYIIAYLDRVNVGFAGLSMTKDLQFSNSVFGLGSGIFFIGYFLLEIPGTVVVEVWSARKWIARIMISWGILASATGFINSAWQFYAIRFGLGLAEAGFFPGLLVYLSHWYRPEDRGKAVAMFMAAIPASQLVGAPLAAILLQTHWMGLGGWRWLLLLEGLPAVIFGIATLFYLTDKPADAKWLPDDEKAWLMGELARERESRGPAVSVWKALRHRDVLLLAAISFFGLTPNYALSLWLPKLVQKLSSFGVTGVSAIAAIPYVISIPLMLLTGRSSDRTGERKWHTAVPRVVSGVALTICFFTLGNAWVSVALLSIAIIGLYCAHPGFWPLPNMMLSRTAAAAGIGMINAFGNLGGFVGPSAIGYLSDKTGGFGPGLLAVAVCAYLSGFIVYWVKAPGQLRESGSANT